MESIKKNEFSILSFFLMRCFFTGIVIHNLVFLVKQDSIFSILISFLVGFIPILIFYKLLTFDDNLNINDISKKYCGKILGTIFNLIFIASVLFHASIVLWNLTNFINSQFLFKTPILAISIVFMIPIIYTVTKGLKTIGRTSTVLFLLSVFMFIISSLSLLPKVQINNLFPIFEASTSNILDGAFITNSYITLSLFPLLIIKKKNINENKKIGKSLIKAYIYAFITILVTMFLILTIFGSTLANLYQYPEYHLLKTINIANFFQRVESILSVQWMFDFSVALMVYVYFLKTNTKQIFNIKKYDKFLIILFSIIIIILSTIIFKNNTVAYNFLGKFYKYIRTLISLIIPLFILIIATLRRKLSFYFCRDNYAN